MAERYPCGLTRSNHARTPLQPAGLRIIQRDSTLSLPANREASFSQPATESLYICELAGSAVWLRSLRRTLLLWRSRHSCVRSLFPRSSSLACVHSPHRNQLPSKTTACAAAVTPLPDNEQGEHAAVDGRRALPWRGGSPVVERLFVERAAHAARVRGGARYQRADGIRAMPSARALLVASLLTEPPNRCLGPSGNDRYRKRSLRSQTVGASQVNCQVAAALSQ